MAQQDRLIIAPADKITPMEFFDAITGSSPERRAERNREMDEQCIRAIQRGDTYGWPPSAVDRCNRIIAEREVQQLESGTAEIRARTEALKAKIDRRAA